MNETPSETGTSVTHTSEPGELVETAPSSETHTTRALEAETPEGQTKTIVTEDTRTPSEEEEAPELETHRGARPQRTHSMREMKVGKVVVNISTGQSGEPLEKAMTILENMTGQRPCTRRARQTIRSFGIRRREPIACLVTLRGDRAEEFLRKGFSAVGNRINPRSFDRNGNFAFGISEHIDIPGQRYDPNLGIIGMDVAVALERPGYRVARKRRARSKVGRSHRVTKEEAIEFIKNRFGVEVGLSGD